jgi:predicted DCC family thiol-disulfide oxidoreductase YuxK
MDSQKISSRLRYIDGKFDEGFRALGSDAIFSQKKNVYLSEDKKRLLAKWEAIIKVLQALRWLIRTNGFQLSLFRNPNRFVVEHYARNRYYAMVGKLRGLFGNHEEFARSFLDDASREGFSTMARFAYAPRYFYFLNYPQEFLDLLEPDIDPAIRWMIRVPKERETDVVRRLEHDAVNVRYYFRNRIRNALRIIAIY